MTNGPRPLDCLLLAVSLIVLSACVRSLSCRDNGEESQRRRLSLQVSASSQKKKTFKILQLADMHFGEDWEFGHTQDAKTFQVLDSVIPAEKPDLIVLSGDQITANNIDENATAVYRNICEHLAKHKVPWAMVFGNHDDAPLETPGEEEGTILQTPAKTSREDLYHVDHSFAPLSLTEMGPKTLFGTSNYILDVHEPGDGNRVALQLLFLDTGGGSLPKQLEANQVEWFQSQRKEKNGQVPIVAFQHIPTKQFVYKGEKCEGLHDDGVDTIEHDPKIVDALVDDGNVQLLAVGHDHGNDYCCSYKHMHLCFGRHSGYGGYGRWARGARVYDIEIASEREEEEDDEESAGSDQEVKVRWRSWVRMENGDVEDEYNPFDDREGDNSWWGNW
jgi:predicted MPP superfamily phosphohydrolase